MYTLAALSDVISSRCYGQTDLQSSSWLLFQLRMVCELLLSFVGLALSYQPSPHLMEHSSRPVCESFTRGFFVLQRGRTERFLVMPAVHVEARSAAVDVKRVVPSIPRSSATSSSWWTAGLLGAHFVISWALRALVATQGLYRGQGRSSIRGRHGTSTILSC